MYQVARRPLGEGAIAILAWVGGMPFSERRALRDVLRPPFEGGEIARQIYEIGWRSAPDRRAPALRLASCCRCTRARRSSGSAPKP